MLYLDGIGISFLVKEIKEKILRYKLTKIFQYDRVSFSLFFGKNNLLFQVKDNSTIFYLKDEKDPNTDFLPVKISAFIKKAPAKFYFN